VKPKTDPAPIVVTKSEASSAAVAVMLTVFFQIVKV
jgi:hypothetical protein